MYGRRETRSDRVQLLVLAGWLQLPGMWTLQMCFERVHGAGPSGTSRKVGTARLMTAPPAGRSHTDFNVFSSTLGTNFACAVISGFDGPQSRVHKNLDHVSVLKTCSN